jgi:predicted nuclease with TOPRIM domain
MTMDELKKETQEILKLFEQSEKPFYEGMKRLKTLEQQLSQEETEEG